MYERFINLHQTELLVQVVMNTGNTNRLGLYDGVRMKDIEIMQAVPYIPKIYQKHGKTHR